MVKLRTTLTGGMPIQAMATHSPLSAKLAEEAGFEALWASGFELSALYGLPDVSLITMTQHLEMVRAIARATSLPIVADIDTGFDNAVNVVHAIKEYERAGAAAVVIEGKIEAARATRYSDDFVIIARTEALIAGLGQDETLKRAAGYAASGADMVLVHSKQKTPDEIEAFIDAWDGRVPFVLVPTSYPQMTVARMKETGRSASSSGATTPSGRP